MYLSLDSCSSLQILVPHWNFCNLKLQFLKKPHIWCMNAQQAVSLSQPSEIWDWCHCVTDMKSVRFAKSAFPKALSCGHLDFIVVNCESSLSFQCQAEWYLERNQRGGIIQKSFKNKPTNHNQQISRIIFLKLFSETMLKINNRSTSFLCWALQTWTQHSK